MCPAADRILLLPLHSGRAIDELPWKLESFGQMRDQRFHAKNFRRVMSAEQEIHSEFFGGNSSPMRSFASDERVDILLSDAINLRPAGACHHADDTTLLWAKFKNLNRCAQSFA